MNALAVLEVSVKGATLFNAEVEEKKVIYT